MLKIKANLVGDTLYVELVGTINEDADFREIAGFKARALIIRCKEVDRLNSIGVRNWCKYFQSLRNFGTQLQFLECSTSIIVQGRLMSGFIGPKEIISFCMPYFCAKCEKEHVEVVHANVIRQLAFVPPTVRCPECNLETTFDEDPDGYFRIFKE